MKNLEKLFENTFKEQVKSSERLPVSGSRRVYYRITSNNYKAIGAFNEDKKENKAFVSYTEQLLKKGIKVPKIHAVDMEKNIYLLQDLGNTTLFDYLKKNKTFDDNIISIYKKIIKQLIDLQLIKNIDYSFAYPRASFDEQSIKWDLNYFKYNFLKFTNIHFDEQLLENDFDSFTKILLSVQKTFFMFRDFQSRNIMLFKDEIYFIDYQGGRQGTLQYDIASLIYDAKANIPESTRKELLNYYFRVLSSKISINRKDFLEKFNYFSLVRILQAFGAYGFRGLFEKKKYFIDSIPCGIENLKIVLNNILPHADKNIKYLLNILNNLTKLDFSQYKNKLKINIFSFSYHRGVPLDKTGNGGGFIFDCRLLHNPGRYEKYKNLTGNDQEVISFFQENEKEVNQFLENIYSIANQAITKYQKRGFTNLSFAFGCTGGQHRSVYSANKLKDYLKNFDIEIELKHLEIGSNIKKT